MNYEVRFFYFLYVLDVDIGIDIDIAIIRWKMKVTATFFFRNKKSFITSKEQHKYNGVHQHIFNAY
jgi:hypothetical protein